MHALSSWFGFVCAWLLDVAHHFPSLFDGFETRVVDGALIATPIGAPFRAFDTSAI